MRRQRGCGFEVFRGEDRLPCRATACYRIYVMRNGSAVAVLIATVALACGEDRTRPNVHVGFQACGGDLVAGWTLVAAQVSGAGDGCAPAAGEDPISGDLFFNADGRYSLSAKVKAWKKTPEASACDFATAYGGFYRTQGSRVCLANSSVQGDDVPCDTTDALSRGVADYCVNGDKLTLETSSMIDLRFDATLELRRKP